MKNSISIGIDVSKSRLDVFLLPQKKHFHYPNNERGIGDLLQILSSLPNPLWRIVLEPSGGVLRIKTAQVKRSKDHPTF